MEVIITETAKNRLKDIYQYYKKVASIKIARRIKQELIQRIQSLKHYKDIGPIDEYLEYLKKGHRKLTEGNFKIVYRIQENTIFITDIFDTRQHPGKQQE